MSLEAVLAMTKVKALLAGALFLFSVSTILMVTPTHSWSLTRGDDWRGDPCARAGIPWTPFTTTARLDPEKTARLVTRSEGHSSHFRTREEIHVVQGTEDTIVASFDVKLSDESLQDHVNLVQQENEAALVIDGHGVGDKRHSECVVAVTTLSLPQKLHQMVIDAKLGSVHIEDVKSSMDTLEILVSAGSVVFRDGEMHMRHLNVNVNAGGILLDSEIYADEQDVNTRAGSIRGTLYVSEKATIGSRSTTGNVELLLLDGKQTKETASEIDVLLAAGNLELESKLTHSNLTADTRTGSLYVSVDADVVTETKLETSMGKLQFPSAMTIVEERRGSVGHMVRGKIGRGPAASHVDLGTQTGSIHLTTSAEAAEHAGL